MCDGVIGPPYSRGDVLTDGGLLGCFLVASDEAYKCDEAYKYLFHIIIYMG